MKVSMDIVDIRPAIEGDHGFIIKTWLNGLYFGNEYFNDMVKNTFFDFYKQVIISIINRPETKIKVISLREDQEVIIAYCVYSKNILHYVYVKPLWRRNGLAKEIISQDVKTVTHLTRIGKSIKPKAWRYNPFFI